ncbi:sacsin-like [Octopus sinensis]|uniref:Sacsin-like n=1 Tax=Octopus sinensis TaxID=2607531 RepID=A0A7E6EIK7_9MOLL|nr:sacsin-like [Octopus sinensis]
MKGQKSVVYGKIILDCNPVTQDLYKLKIGPLSTDVAHVSVQNLFKIFRSTQPSDFTLPEETRQEHDFDEQTTNDVFPSEESVPTTYFNSLHQEVKGGGDSDIKNMKFIQEYVKVESEIKNQISDLKQKSLEERKKNIKKLMLRWHPDKNPNDTELSTAVFKLINSEVETSCLFDESKKNVWEFMGHSDWDSFYDSIRKKAKEKESSTPSKETSEPPKKTSAQSKETWKPSSQASETSKETSTTDEPVEEEKSQMWMRQAKADLETAACLDFSRTGSFEWMAFIACQVCLS